jgi:hypothetical protein
MKKILLIVTLGLFLGAASVSAAEIGTATHKTAKTEMKASKSDSQKKGHKKAHKKGKKTKGQKAASVNK